MSLPDMLGGVSECGPVNPMQQLGKRFGQDRGAQFDQLRPSGDVSGARPGGFRTHRGAPEDPAFFARDTAPAPFQVQELRQALPPLVSKPAWQAPPAWEASFERGRAASAAPAWAQDFMQAGAMPVQSKAGPSVNEPLSAPVGVAQAAAGPAAPLTQFRRPFPAMPPPMVAHAPPPMQSMAPADALERVSQSSWDSAFTAVDTQQPAVAPAEHASELDHMNADDLAEAAERLLHAVQHDQSDKFKQSEFLRLMEKLRDRQAEVHGSEIVDKGKGKAKGPPSQAHLDDMLRQATPMLSRTGQPQTAPPQAQAQLQEFWMEEDAAREQPLHTRTFVGDGGDVAARMREDDALMAQELRAQDNDDLIAREYNKWTSMGANVPGAQSSWEEEMNAEDFVGRSWEGVQGRGRPGAQNGEWAKLQNDWDEFESLEDGMHSTDARRAHAPFPFEAPEYRFHEANPYVDTLQHAAQSPTVFDSVLEHEAAVQTDPRDAAKWYALGLRQQENEREKQAIAALHMALKINPRLKDAWLALAVSYTNENDREEALEALSRWVSVNDTYHDVLQQYERSQNPTKSRHTQLTQLLMAMARAGVPDGAAAIDADIQVALGVLFNASSEYEKAVDCFSAALSVRPDDWILYNRIGATLSNSGRSQESLQHYQQALSLRPDFARCHFNMSISYLNLKQYQEAAEHAFTALHLQHASQNSDPSDTQNSSVWEILRVSLELYVHATHRSMRRPDLASLCATRDVNAIRVEDIVGS
ncbi:hypothetical protein MCAP1_000804 [Malassezia caprae]|uniref:Peroxisomal targeting signal receptor n=1 Tax=Malassezia caprae TaxID=1381934 RepID=A0AAF0E5J3_9BASI|nr:hypothetical protein MCAP1_000804 [Malassezia caprae]